MNRWNRLGFPLSGALLAACNLLPWSDDGVPAPDAPAIADGGPDARRDASFVDLDAGPSAYPLPDEFTGAWATLPGLEGYPIWRARTPAASAPPIRWKACTGETPGCEELVVDWTDARHGGALDVFPGRGCLRPATPDRRTPPVLSRRGALVLHLPTAVSAERRRRFRGRRTDGRRGARRRRPFRPRRGGPLQREREHELRRRHLRRRGGPAGAEFGPRVRVPPRREDDPQRRMGTKHPPLQR